MVVCQARLRQYLDRSVGNPAFQSFWHTLWVFTDADTRCSGHSKKEHKENYLTHSLLSCGVIF